MQAGAADGASARMQDLVGSVVQEVHEVHEVQGFTRFKCETCSESRTRIRTRIRARHILSLLLVAASAIVPSHDSSAQTPPNLAGKWTLNRALSQWPKEIGFDVDFSVPPIEGQDRERRAGARRRAPSRPDAPGERRRSPSRAAVDRRSPRASGECHGGADRHGRDLL